MGGKGGLLEKALSIIPGTAAPRPPCVMMREVFRELGGQPVDGNDHTHDPTRAAHSPGSYTPTLPSSWAGCWCTGVPGGMCRNAKSTACVKCKAKV